MGKRWRWGAIGIGLVGLLLRVHSALVNDVSPDAPGYAILAADFSFREPWAAGDREPLWLAFVKLTAGPFDYSNVAMRATSLVLSMVALALCWRLVSQHLPPRSAVVAFAFLAVHPLLVTDAALGVREPAVLALTAWTARCLLERRGGGAWIGLLLAIRWEIGLLWLAVAAVGALSHRIRPQVIAIAGVVGLILVGPFLIANGSEYGDLLHHSDRHAVYYRNIEQGWADGIDPYKADRFRGEPITWGDYYLDFVGPEESLNRVAYGMVTVPLRVSGFGNELVGAVVVAMMFVGVIVRRTLLAMGAALFLAGGAAGYAGIAWIMEYRLVSLLALPAAVLLGHAIGMSPRGTSQERAGTRDGCGEGVAPRSFRGEVR